MFAIGIISLSICLLILLPIVIGTALKTNRLEEMVIKMDEYIMSKIMASDSGKYDGIFTPKPKELQIYRTRRGRERSQS